jgi:hypothetical protein
VSVIGLLAVDVAYKNKELNWKNWIIIINDFKWFILLFYNY